ncbi:ASCH domain-containing protein (plasmid) [Burkholderia aenigmatica]|uniref:ASCH domain-containing protein n=1 Tax=Burkholderia aenigmatica TaxID=2015348 RepID=UPI003B433E69
MKALSIRQPWAWLIAAGHKDIENRTWRTHYRGALLIHASAGMTRREYLDVCAYLDIEIGGIQLPGQKAMERGGIVGIADLFDCVPPADRTSPWHMAGCHGFALRNARQLPFIPYKGQRGIFDVPRKDLLFIDEIADIRD